FAWAVTGRVLNFVQTDFWQETAVLSGDTMSTKKHEWPAAGSADQNLSFLSSRTHLPVQHVGQIVRTRGCRAPHNLQADGIRIQPRQLFSTGRRFRITQVDKLL